MSKLKLTNKPRRLAGRRGKVVGSVVCVVEAVEATSGSERVVAPREVVALVNDAGRDAERVVVVRGLSLIHI